MRAFAVDEFGAAGSIHQIPIPEPGTGEVLVSVHASAVNAMDPLYVAGVMQEYMEHRFPLVAGIDFAGVVATVGPEVDGVATGDEVYGALAKPFVGAGTFAEQVVVAAEDVAPKPGSLDFAQAAAVPHVGLTALAAIEAADPTPGQVVVVIGATGGVGSFATQLAAARGATVVAVTAAPNAELARELGATGTIDYASEDVAAALRARFPGGIDTLIATHGDLELIGSVARTLRPGGLVVSPAVRPDAAAALLEPLGFTFKGANRLPPARLPELTALLDGGQLRVPPITSFTLEETGAALESMATGHTRGKLVITVA